MHHVSGVRLTTAYRWHGYEWFQQGYGIGVYEPCAAYSGSYSPHYTMFYGLGSDFVPVLTVTYS